MSNANPSRLGQVNLAGDPRAMFLKVFGGEVLAAFHRTSAFRPRHMVRTIPNGKSATFPRTGRISAGYMMPGTELLGTPVSANEKIITIGDLLVSHAFISNIDEAMNFFDVRSIYSGEIGDKLGRVFDQNVSRTAILNARATAPITGMEDGGYSNDAGYSTDGTKLFTGIFNAGVLLDTKDVPTEGRSAFIRPVQYALVVQSEKPISTWLNANGNNGSYASGEVREVNSIELVKTNNLANLDDRANTDVPTDQRGDFSVTQALIQHRDAIGTVALQDVTMESEYDMRRQGTLMLGKYLVGHGGLRPEAGYELRTADPS